MEVESTRKEIPDSFREKFKGGSGLAKVLYCTMSRRNARRREKFCESSNRPDPTPPSILPHLALATLLFLLRARTGLFIFLCGPHTSFLRESKSTAGQFGKKDRISQSHTVGYRPKDIVNIIHGAPVPYVGAHRLHRSAFTSRNTRKRASDPDL